MTEKQLLQHGFKKQSLVDEVALEMHGSYDHIFTKEFPYINLQVGVQLHHNAYQLSYLESGAIIRSIPKTKLHELLHYLDDLERVAKEFNNIESLLEPVFDRWQRQKQLTTDSQ